MWINQKMQKSKAIEEQVQGLWLKRREVCRFGNRY